MAHTNKFLWCWDGVSTLGLCTSKLGKKTHEECEVLPRGSNIAKHPLVFK